MNIKKMNINDLRPADYNPRVDLKETDPEFKQIEHSIDEFGMVDPLVYNEQTGQLVSGHQRRHVLIKKGVKEVYVTIVNLPLQKEKELNLLLNKAVGRWDFNRLATLLDEMSRIPDFDIQSTGFSLPEVSGILDKYLNKPDEDDFDFNQAVDSIKKPLVKKGDIIELGPHRIMCGDTANPDDLKTLMRGEKIDLIHMDPPYGCLYLAQNRPDLESRPKKSKRWEKLYKDDLSEKEYETWIKSILGNTRSFLNPGASAYIWNGHAKFYFMHQALKELGFHISTVITWAKPTFAISYGDYNQQTEFCIYSWLENAPHKWYGPTNASNLWQIEREDTANLIHPTQKSVDIPVRAIENSSKRDDIVFDGFMGSGSTLIASEKLGRRFRGIEIEPKYVSAIILRFLQLAPDKVSKEVREKYLGGSDENS